MIKKLLKNKLFIILVILAVILIVVKITSANKTPTDFSIPTQPSTSKNSTSSNSPLQPSNDTPSQNTTNNPDSPTPTIKITEINYQIPLYNFLPYQGKYFRAERYIAANNLEIIVPRQELTDKAKKEVLDWFTLNDVDKLDTYTIIYR